jgi:NitT/TauT family transport system substrate-binding protein
MKRVHLFLILMTVFGIVVSACISQAPQTPQVPASPVMTTIKVIYVPTTSNGPLFIAKDEGFFAKQGINVEFEKFPNVAAALPLLISGDLAVSGGPVTPGLINAVAQGAHVRIVADKGRVAPGYCAANALLVRRDLFDNGTIKNVSDLKGRKIMGNTGDQTYGIARLLAMGNLTINDIELVDLDFPTGVVALKNGAIDAGVFTEPYITQAVNNGSAVMLMPAQDYMPDYPYPLYYGPAILDKNPALGRNFMVAYLQGVKQYNEGKTERNLAIMENYTHLSRELLNQSCWYPIAEDGNIPWKPIGEYIDWSYANKDIPQKLTEDQLYDMSYVTYANAILRNMTTNG